MFLEVFPSYAGARPVLQPVPAVPTVTAPPVRYTSTLSAEGSSSTFNAGGSVLLSRPAAGDAVPPLPHAATQVQ
jgi:hypothetical protein